MGPKAGSSIPGSVALNFAVWSQAAGKRQDYESPQSGSVTSISKAQIRNLRAAGSWSRSSAFWDGVSCTLIQWSKSRGDRQELSERQEYKFSWPFVRVKKQRNHRRARSHFHLTPWKLYNGMTSDDTLVAMLAVAASSRNPLFQKGKWRL